MLQTGMGACPQLLSSLYVSSKAWPSSLMSLLMTSWSRQVLSALARLLLIKVQALSREPGRCQVPPLPTWGALAFPHCLLSDGL